RGGQAALLVPVQIDSHGLAPHFVARRALHGPAWSSTAIPGAAARPATSLCPTTAHSERCHHEQPRQPDPNRRARAFEVHRCVARALLLNDAVPDADERDLPLMDRAVPVEGAAHHDGVADEHALIVLLF